MSDIQLAWSFLTLLFSYSVASLFFNPMKMNSDLASAVVIVGRIVFCCFVVFSLVAVLIWALEVVTK